MATDNSNLIELIRDLRENYSHAFLDVEGAKHFSKPFGFEATVYEAIATPREPKGLRLNDGMLSATGIASDDLACQIARHLGLAMPTFSGRGFRLRVACDLVEAELRAMAKEPIT